MTTALQLRRGTTTQHTTFTGAVGEVSIDTSKKTAVVHDGVTAGGTPLAKESDVNVRVRYDAAQGLDSTQQSTARQNLNAAPLPGTSGIIVRNAADSTVSRSLAAGSGISVINADGTAGNPTITNTGVLSVNGQTGNITLSVSASDKVSKAGDTMTGPLTVPQLNVSSTGPLITLADTDWGNRHIHTNGGMVGFLDSGGNWAMYENNSGFIWTKGYGWLHERFAAASHSHGYVPTDAGAGGVGSFSTVFVINTNVGAGGAISGAYVRFAKYRPSGWEMGETNLSGTWRNMTTMTVNSNDVAVFQRIS